MTADTYQLIGAYAVDAVDDAERELLDRYLAEDPEYFAEMTSLRDAAAELSVLAEAEPPASLRSSVLTGIAQTRPLPPVAPEAEDTSAETDVATAAAPEAALVDEIGQARERRTRRRGGGWLLSAAAAVALLTTGVGIATWAPWQQETTTTIAADVTDAPDAKSYTLKLGDHRATVTRSESEGRAVLTSDDLAPPPEGKDYQMWLQQPDGHMAPAGVVPEVADDGSVTMVLDGDAAKAVGTGMTLEPTGGSEQPTSDPMGLLEF